MNRYPFQLSNYMNRGGGCQTSQLHIPTTKIIKLPPPPPPRVFKQLQCIQHQRFYEECFHGCCIHIAIVKTPKSAFFSFTPVCMSHVWAVYCSCLLSKRCVCSILELQTFNSRLQRHFLCSLFCYNLTALPVEHVFIQAFVVKYITRGPMVL